MSCLLQLYLSLESISSIFSAFICLLRIIIIILHWGVRPLVIVVGIEMPSLVWRLVFASGI